MRNGRRRVIVWGAGGHGKVTVDALLASGSCEVVGVADDDRRKAGSAVLGIPVLDSSAGLAALAGRIDFDAVAIAIGDNYSRAEKFQEVCELGFELVNTIHPSARVSKFVELGRGVTILAGATVNPGTVIEDNVCVNTSASVDHDNRLQQNCHIFPNATLAGGVRVGAYSYLGSGAVVVPNVTVGEHSYVGAGAVVLKDVRAGIVVAGNPAEEIRLQTKRPNSRSQTPCLSKP